MNATVLILFNVFLVCWLSFYLLIFNRTTFFKTNRFILLSGIFLAVLFSFVPFQWTSNFSPQLTRGSGPILISAGEDIVQPFSAASAFPFWKLIIYIYWAGVAFMFSRMMYKLWCLYKVAQKYPHKRYKDHTHVIMDQDQIFSFTKFLFAPENIPDSIYKHELIHIREKHSFDNLLMELVTVFCWFNPFVYFYQLTLKTVHEYLADAGATAYFDRGEYARLLVSRSFNISETTLVHYFFKRSHLQKRLIMLQKKNVSRKTGWKYLLVLPLIAVLIFITSSSFAWRSKIDHVVSKLKVSGNLSPVPDQSVTVQGTLTNQEGNPLSNATVMLVGTTKGTITNTRGHFTLKDVPSASWLNISRIGYTAIAVKVQQEPLHLVMYRQPAHINKVVVVGYTKEKLQPRSTNDKQAGSPFMFVEQMPSFPGGKEALMRYLHDHIRYPQQARKQHLQGTVIVNFVVEKDGSIKNIQTINAEIGGGLEQEAERIVRNMPKWHPAKQNGEKVNVLYTLPIRFVLQ